MGDEEWDFKDGGAGGEQTWTRGGVQYVCVKKNPQISGEGSEKIFLERVI